MIAKQWTKGFACLMTFVASIGCDKLSPLDKQVVETSGRQIQIDNGDASSDEFTRDDLVGDFVRGAVLSDGRHVLAYYNKTRGKLAISIEKASGSNHFKTDLIGAGSTDNIGTHVDLAVAADDSVHVVFYDKTHGQLLYAKGNGSNAMEIPIIIDDGWRGTGLNKTHHRVGMGSALDESGRHLVYYDSTAGDLLYAHRDEQGRWQRRQQPLLSQNDVGRYASVAANDKGEIFVAAYNATYGDLLFYRAASADMLLAEESEIQFTAIDREGDVGQFADLAIDSQGRPVVAYYDAINGDLKLARPFHRNLEAGSHIATVDSEGNVGMDISLRLDEHDLAHISYSDVSSFDLKYASEQQDGSFNFKALDTEDIVCCFTSLLDHRGPDIYYNVSKRERPIEGYRLEEKVFRWPPSDSI